MSNENQTKKCKHCKTDIPKSAKVCPNCHKKQGGKIKWIVIVIILILIIAAVAGGKDNKPKKVDNSGQENQASTQKEGSSDAKDQDVFHIGETAELNDVRVTMTNYEESDGSEYNTPADGNKFVLIEFEIENNSSSDLAISSMVSFEAYADDYSLDYSLSALVEKGSNQQLDGTIASGKKMKGVIGYEVPEDWKNIEIHFKDNVWSNSKFVFELIK